MNPPRILLGSLPALAALSLLGCDPDCDNPSRLNGLHNVWSNVVEHNPAPDAIPEEYPVSEIFYNGHSEWQLRYVQAQRSFDVDIDGQKYSADFAQDDDNCNAFTLDLAGTYISAGGTSHDFVWSGDMVYFGTHMGGTFAYESSWTDVNSSTSGHVRTRGELRSSTKDDTGF